MDRAPSPGLIADVRALRWLEGDLDPALGPECLPLAALSVPDLPSTRDLAQRAGWRGFAQDERFWLVGRGAVEAARLTPGASLRFPFVEPQLAPLAHPTIEALLAGRERAAWVFLPPAADPGTRLLRIALEAWTGSAHATVLDDFVPATDPTGHDLEWCWILAEGSTTALSRHGQATTVRALAPGLDRVWERLGAAATAPRLPYPLRPGDLVAGGAAAVPHLELLVQEHLQEILAGALELSRPAWAGSPPLIRLRLVAPEPWLRFLSRAVPPSLDRYGLAGTPTELMGFCDFVGRFPPLRRCPSVEGPRPQAIRPRSELLAGGPVPGSVRVRLG